MTAKPERAVSKRSSDTRRYGFTILEMLVTISIIVVLTALLLSSVQRVFDTQEQLACTLSLRAIGQGAAQYGIDYKQALPTHEEGARPKFEQTSMRTSSGGTVNTGDLLKYIPESRLYYCPTLNEENSPGMSLDTTYNPWNDGLGGPNKLRSSFAVRTRRFAGGTLPRWTVPNHNNKVIYTDFIGVEDKPSSGPFKVPVDAPHDGVSVNRLFGDGAVLWASTQRLNDLRPVDDKIPTPKQMSEYFDLLDLVP